MWNLLCSFRILSHPRDHSGKSNEHCMNIFRLFQRVVSCFGLNLDFQFTKFQIIFLLYWVILIYYNLHFFSLGEWTTVMPSNTWKNMTLKRKMAPIMNLERCAISVDCWVKIQTFDIDFKLICQQFWGSTS